MGRESTGGTFFDGLLGKVLRRKPIEPARLAHPALAMLERLHAGEQPDYCLYLRPPAGGAAVKRSLISFDLEDLLTQAFDPLAMITLDEFTSAPVRLGQPRDAGLPDEAFLTLANRARLLCVVPTSDPRFIARLKILKTIGPITRCVFVMPEAGTLGTADWPAIWPAARESAATLGVNLSGYTAGGWLFRIDKDGNAVTFRPIVNPNPQKIAKALESICVEMS